MGGKNTHTYMHVCAFVCFLNTFKSKFTSQHNTKAFIFKSQFDQSMIIQHHSITKFSQRLQKLNCESIYFVFKQFNFLNLTQNINLLPQTNPKYCKNFHQPHPLVTVAIANRGLHRSLTQVYLCYHLKLFKNT